MTTRPLGSGDSFMPRPRTAELSDPQGAGNLAPGGEGPAGTPRPSVGRRDEWRVTRPLPQVPAPTPQPPAERVEMPSRPRTLWERMKQAVGGAAQEASEVAGAIRSELAEAEQKIENAVDAVERKIIETGRRLYEKILDPFIDGTPLGPDDEFQDAGGGLSRLLTNRLAIGESASIQISAGGDIPTEFLGLPNVKLDGGGTLEIKRVPRRDESGNPLTGPLDARGNPPTELEVKLTLENRTGLAYEAAVGARAGLKIGKHVMGASASAEASVEAGVAGKLTYTFSFDPRRPAHMETLSGLVGAMAHRDIQAQMPDLARELPRESRGGWLDHLTAMEGEGGLFAQASASADARLGLTKLELESDAEQGADRKPRIDRSAGTLAEPEVGSLREAGMDQLLEKLGFPVGEVAAALGGEARMGVRQDLRSGDRTVYVKVGGEGKVGGQAFGFGKEVSSESNRRLALQIDREGRLKQVSIEETHSRERFNGIRTTVEDVFGRPLDEGFVASIGDEDTVQVRYNVRPELLANLSRKLDGNVQDRAGALRDLASLAINRKTVQLELPNLIARHTDAFELGGEIGLKLLGAVAVRGNVTLARGQETALASDAAPRI